MADLAVIGSIPPPFGGLTTHVQRLLPLLHDRGISFQAYNAVSSAEHQPDVISVAAHRHTWLIRFLATCEESAIFLLTDRIGVWCLAVVAAYFRGKRVAVRLRNSVLIDITNKGGWLAAMANFAIRSMDLVVCVNEELVEYALATGIEPDKVIHVPGFLPPTERCKDRRLVSDAVWRFLNGKNPVIAANGKIRVYEGVDLYGLDLLIELLSRLKPDFPEIGLIFCFWEHSDREEESLNRLRDEAGRLGLDESVYFNTETGVFLPVLAEATVFIRPTATDGDANSVREALSLGIPVIASDVVSRPKGCKLHENRSIDHLEAVTRRALAENLERAKSQAVHVDDETLKRIDLYLASLEKLAYGGRTAA